MVYGTPETGSVKDTNVSDVSVELIELFKA